ncbi:MAG: 3-carboxy-cis,cis-muconate cycloisomerase [Caldilineaceae bacterium]
MAFSPTDSALFSQLFGDAELADIFADEQFVRDMLTVESALAQTQGRLGVIPPDAAASIADAAAVLAVDFALLQAGTEKAGLPVIELLRQLRAAVTQSANADAAAFVHWGATTQDIMDTALILQLRAALLILENKLQQVSQNLAHLADRHRHTLMAGRTHSQQALPITFGLKVAGWLAPLLRHQQRLAALKQRLLTVQFGGAAGTLASLHEEGLAVVEGLAQMLQLEIPLMPWHTQRDNLAEVAGWLALVSGSLAKMAQDMILLAQSEVSEVQESSDRSRGGSSTMPQKSNPIVSELIIAAARTNASHLTAMHQALIQEHERATHGWQMEWLTLPQMFALTATALNKALFLSKNLAIDEGRMAQNVAASNGLMLAEAVSFALAEQMDRTQAKQLVTQAVQIALAEHRHLVDVVQTLCDLPLDWVTLRDERNYLGATQSFIDRVLQATQPS